MKMLKNHYTFHGAAVRLQLTIYDFTNPPGMMKAEPRPTFSLYALAQTTHKSTAFYRGKQLCHGSDPREAMTEIAKWAPNCRWPQELRPYLLRWGLQAVVDALRTYPLPERDSVDEIYIGPPKREEDKGSDLVFVYCDGGHCHFSRNSDYPAEADKEREKLAAVGRSLGYRMEEFNSWSVGFYDTI